jgi:hypothetical protein
METIHTKKGTRRHDDLNLCNLSLTYSARRDSRDLVGVPGYGAFSKEEEGAVSTDDNLPLERLDGPKFIFVALQLLCRGVWYHIVDSQDAPETCLLYQREARGLATGHRAHNEHQRNTVKETTVE